MKPSNVEVSVEIAPPFRGHVTARGLIQPRGTIEFQTNYSQVGPGYSGFIGKVTAPDYRFEAGFTDTTLYITRNESTLHYPLRLDADANESVHFFALWDVDRLKLVALDDSFKRAVRGLSQCAKEREIEKGALATITPPTIPPPSLLDWAREQAILPTITYDSAGQFNEVVVSSFESIEDGIKALGSNNAFWNVNYDGARIVSRLPKTEPDIHPTIHARLFHIATAKDFHIVPEYQIAGGRLDFLISGPLSSGKRAFACVEFKHAHSDDLERGLLLQLPAYMQAKACAFGIYCVLYFKGKHFHRPLDHDEHSLRILLEKERRAAGLHGIRTMVLNVGHLPTPSQR